MKGFWRSFAGKRVSVVGAGKSGRAVRHLLLKLGARVFITERAPLSPHELASLAPAEAGGHTARALNCSLVVPCPGVPPSNPVLRWALRNRVPVMSELELAWRLLPSRKVAVTGTDGKTTTVSMLARILGAPAAGNIGTPLSSLVRYGPPELVAVEVSSFQLALSSPLNPEVAVVTNVVGDHLDWHGSVDEYIEAKKRLFLGQNEEGVLVLNLDDPVSVSFVREARGRVLFFSLKDEADAYLRGSELWVMGKRLMARDELPLLGLHNVQNALAAALAARALGLENPRIAEALRSFRGLPHRYEPVAELNGVLFVNDSKATTPNATRAALLSSERPVLLIMGGLAKGADFSSLAPLVAEKVRALVVFGRDKERIAEALGGAAPLHLVRDLEEAVALAWRLARKGDMVLLSPGCASFDQYGNYRERGEHFKALVEGLVSGR